MDEQVAGAALAQEVAAERQHGLDMLTLGRLQLGLFLDDVVETQFQPLMLAIGPECGRRRPTRIQDRQNVADPDLAVAFEFFQAAYGKREGHEICACRHDMVLLRRKS
jgi:hypothetical protein